MGKCLWCDKELDAPEATVCPSCVFRPISEAVAEQKARTPEGVDPNLDLSVFGIKKNPQEGKRAGELKSQLLKASMVPQKPKVNNMVNKVVKVKSRNVRERSIIVNDLVLTFDAEGIATILEADAYVIDEYNKVRPGRMWVVREEAPAVAEESKSTTSLPEVPAEPVVSEEKPEEKPEEVKVKPEPKKVAPKRATPKKRTTKKRRTTKKTTSKD